MAESTEKPKKAKAPAKPKAVAGTAKRTSTKKQSAGKQSVARVPAHEEIARLAEQYWAERGHTDGHAEQDWLRAEEELLKRAS